VPSAIKRDEEKAPEGLVTILMERQGADDEALKAFMQKNYPGSRALVCRNGHTPLPSSGGLPHAALIGAEGKLLWTGNPISGERKIEELIESELARVKRGLGETEAERSVRHEIYGQRDYEEALDVIADLEDQELAKALRAELDRVVDQQFRTIRTLQETGFWLEAEKRCEELARAVGRKSPWEARVEETEETFESDKGKEELSADKRLTRFLAGLPRVKDPRQRERAIRTMASKIEGTSVAKRLKGMR